MKLEHFRYLLEIGRLRSISAAARSLHIRQTTLSAIVKSAEEELGYPIFQRTPGGVAATAPGESFLNLAWEIHLKYEELLSLKQRASDEAPTIRLLLPPSVGSSLPVVLAHEFYQYELRGDLAFETHISVDVGGQILNGPANLGLAFLTEGNIAQARSDPQYSELRIQRLLLDHIYLVVSKAHPLSALPEANVEALYAERLATAKSVQDDAVLGRVLVNWPRITRFANVDLMKQAVLTQGMICFLPRYVILSEGNGFSPSQFAVIPVRNTRRPNRLSLCLIHRPEESLSYQEKVLKTCILDYFQRFRAAHKGCFPAEEGFYENGISPLPAGN